MHLHQLPFLGGKLGNQLLILLLKIVNLLLADFADSLLIVNCLLEHSLNGLLLGKLL